MRIIISFLLVFISLYSYSQNELTLINTTNECKKIIQIKRIINVKHMTKNWEVFEPTFQNDTLIFKSFYYKDSIQESYNLNNELFLEYIPVYKDTLVKIKIDEISLINYSKVRNWRHKSEQFGGFGAGYSLSLLTIFSSIGAIVTFAQGDIETGLITTGVAVVSGIVFYISLKRLQLIEYNLKTEWKLEK